MFAEEKDIKKGKGAADSGNTGKGTGKSRIRKRVIRFLCVLAGLFVVVAVALQVVLSPKFIKNLIGRMAPQYIDATVDMGDVEVSLLKKFPHLYVSIEDFSLSYPHDRYSDYDAVGIHGKLRDFGRGSEADTLASFKRLDLSVSYLQALLGKYHIRNVELVKPRIFAHQYVGDAANWNIYKGASSDEEAVSDSTSSPLPNFEVNRVALTESPFVVYTNAEDTVFAAIAMRKMEFKGRLTDEGADKNHIRFSMDSLLVAGRLPADTLALGINNFFIHDHKNEFVFGAKGGMSVALSGLGRARIPVEMSGRVSFPEQTFDNISLRKFVAKLATLEMKAEGDLQLGEDSSYVNAELSLADCKLKELFAFLGSSFVPEFNDIKTDAVMSLTALAQGDFNLEKGIMPQLIAQLVIPSAGVSYDPMGIDGSVSVDINAVSDADGDPTVTIDDFTVDLGGLTIGVSGKMNEFTGGDPRVKLKAEAGLSLDRVSELLPEDFGYLISGLVEAGIDGNFRLSDLSPEKITTADINAGIHADDMSVVSENDSLYVFVGNTDVRIAKGDAEAVLGTADLALVGTVDSLYVNVLPDMMVKGRALKLTAQASAHSSSAEYGDEDSPFVGVVRAGKITMTGADSLLVGVRGSKNTFRFSTRKVGTTIAPLLSFKSENNGIFMRSGVNRVGVKNASFNVSADKAAVELRRAKRNRILDSLHRVYPGVPKDSLFMYYRGNGARPAQGSLASVNKDFEANDFSLDMGETINEYLRNWSFKGGMDIEGGVLITPYFPLKNLISDVHGNFTNDNVSLDNFTFSPGTSDVSASGKVTGLRRAFAGRAPLNVDIQVTSERLNANELLSAFYTGAKYMDEVGADGLNTSLSDEEYMAQVATDTLSAEKVDAYSLIVIPANINANISLQANRIDYRDLQVNWMAADIGMMNRCLRFTNTVATSNMGDIYCEGFYSTLGKDDIRAGFDLNLVDITADKVISLVPQVDTIMPLLKAFKGNLDFTMSATTDLDTNMNILTPTINGIMKISGRKLLLEDDGAFRKLARLLMFKNKKVGKIDDMSVQGLIWNDRLEIFPFILGVDRYSLAMSGLQNFDQTFNYHVSVLKSPVPFRFGVNIFGSFDDWKYRIGKAKYKDANVPVFTTQVDALHMNLVSSIHSIFNKGVDYAFRQNEKSGAEFEARKAELGYDSGMQLDSLDTNEKFAMDSLRYNYEHPMDSSVNARIDSLLAVSMLTDMQEELSFDESIDKLLGNQVNMMAKSAARQAKKDARRSRKEAKKNKDLAMLVEEEM